MDREDHGGFLIKTSPVHRSQGFPEPLRMIAAWLWQDSAEGSRLTNSYPGASSGQGCESTMFTVRGASGRKGEALAGLGEMGRNETGRVERKDTIMQEESEQFA